MPGVAKPGAVMPGATMTTADQWGVPLAGEPSSCEAWAAAYDDYLAFRGDPLGRLGSAIDADPGFVLGRVFRIASLVLAGLPLDHEIVVGDLAGLDDLGDLGDREAGHIAAVRMLAAGEFTEAAALWEVVVDRRPRDLAAIRFAHDVYLHTGNDRARLVSSLRAATSFEPHESAHGHVLGQLAFAYEEVGRHDEALEAAHRALTINADDLWARHAAAHVYEMQGRSEPLYELLEPGGSWVDHDLLAAHLWWHRGIRLVADRRFDDALGVADSLPIDPARAFTLADVTSLLVRIEVGGADVGDRWASVVEAWRGVATRHTCGFLDLHAALAARTDPSFAEGWRDTQRSAHRPPRSENDRLFVEVVEPLTDALALLDGSHHDEGVATLMALSPRLHEVGGSLAQRQVIDLVAGTTVLVLPDETLPDETLP